MTVKCLCIGHGASRSNLKLIRDFDGILISVDASARELIDIGIIPDYMVYSETGHTVIRELEHFLPDYFQKEYISGKMQVIYNKDKMTYIFKDRLKKLGIKNKWWNGRYGEGKNRLLKSVGLYAIGYADNRIGKIEEIHLIGYDYKGLDNNGNDMTETWKEEALNYRDARMGMKRPAVIIDHSGGDFPSINY